MKDLTPQERMHKIVTYVGGFAAIFSAIFMIIPGLNPARFITWATGSSIKQTNPFSVVATKISELKFGLDDAFAGGFVSEGIYNVLFVMALIVMISIFLNIFNSICSFCPLPVQKFGMKVGIITAITQLAGTLGISVCYLMVCLGSDLTQVTVKMPAGLIVYMILAIIVFACTFRLYIYQDKLTAEEKSFLKENIPLYGMRIMSVVTVASMFFPGINPARIIIHSGQADIRQTSSLFTSGISFSGLTTGLKRAFQQGWVDKWVYVVLFIACMVMVLGILCVVAHSILSLGNVKCKKLGVRIGIAGILLEAIGYAGSVFAYIYIVNESDPAKIVTQFPSGLIVYGLFFAASIIFSIIVMMQVPKVSKEELKAMPYEMDVQFRLFLMLTPFLALAFAFSYLPLYSWRYAFFDYSVGTSLSWDNWAGMKWFQILFMDATYLKRIGMVMRNTLVMSGLGVLTSWVPMVFAIFLNEIKTGWYKRMVQIFTTIPNFISWVLVYAIAFAIFNTDGFINTLMNEIMNTTTYNANYLEGDTLPWIKMLAWGMWKGVGWSAIIYIAGISGIDQQLYEAATVDGAGRFQRMWHITVPGLLPTYVTMLIMSIAGILSNGMDQYLVFTNADNKYTMEVLDLYVYNLGIGSGSIPLSTMVGMLKSVISVLLLFIANKVAKLVRGENIV